MFQSWSGSGGQAELCSAQPLAGTFHSRNQPDGYAVQWIAFGAEGGCYLPPGYSGASLWLYNVHADEEAGGMLYASAGRARVLPRQPVEIGAGNSPWVEVELGLDLPNEFPCGSAGVEAVSYSVGGRWQVIVGGTYGDVVEIEARDVHFDDSGGGLVFDRMYWRVRLQEPPEPPPPPARDGG